jgi:hypothetical protein
MLPLRIQMYRGELAAVLLWSAARAPGPGSIGTVGMTTDFEDPERASVASRLAARQSELVGSRRRDTVWQATCHLKRTTEAMEVLKKPRWEVQPEQWT